MKIRQDFVTNSSSSSSIILTIENPVLLEILQSYKEQGCFKSEGTTFGIGEYPSFPPGFSGLGFFEPDDKIPTPTFTFSEGEEAEDLYKPIIAPVFPNSLYDVLNVVSGIMWFSEYYVHWIDNKTKLRLGQYDRVLFKKLLTELHEKREEIAKAYSFVYCRVYEDNDEAGFISRSLTFSYVPETGIQINESYDKNFDEVDEEESDFPYEDDPHVDEYLYGMKTINIE